jgi:hypothetical protein
VLAVDLSEVAQRAARVHAVDLEAHAEVLVAVTTTNGDVDLAARLHVEVAVEEGGLPGEDGVVVHPEVEPRGLDLSRLDIGDGGFDGAVDDGEDGVVRVALVAKLVGAGGESGDGGEAREQTTHGETSGGSAALVPTS